MILFLPHIFTTLNLFCGFYAIIKIVEGDFYKASWSIFFAIVFDIFDGRIARGFKTESYFGQEYDSLCDLVSFGIAPALLIYQYSLKEFNQIGWLASFLYTSCVALRLAKFNVKSLHKYKHFEGLPSPAGAAILASTVLFLIKKVNFFHSYLNWSILIMVYIIAYLLISPIQYPSFKEIKIKKLQAFYFLLLFILGFTVIASNPSFFLFIIILFYVLLGPILIFKNNSRKIFKKLNRKTRI